MGPSGPTGRRHHTLPVRISPLGTGERTQSQQELIDWAVQGSTVNIYTTLARHPELAERMLPMGRQLRGGRLPLRERETLILRTGWNCGSEYEFAQHRRMSLAGGMSVEDIKRIQSGPGTGGWDPFEEQLCQAADELHENAWISDETWHALATRYDDESLMEVVALVGYYHLVCFLLNSLGVPLEAGAAGFDPE